MKKVVFAAVVLLTMVMVSNVYAVSLVDICQTATTVASVKKAISGGADVNETNSNGLSALMAACSNTSSASVGIVSTLLSSGANTSLKDSLGKTAWDYAKNNTKYGQQITALLDKAKTTVSSVKSSLSASGSSVSSSSEDLGTSTKSTLKNLFK
ncbi:MAG: hypothetical protein II816_03540 [Elusimicrobia bacterium]|nr:hypothetical protein [Elusimicrobiota bacterium]